MKRLIWVLGMVAMVGSSVARAAHLENDFGVGLVIGEPTGFTAKYMLEEDRALQATLAFSFGDYILTSLDYLFHFPGTFARHDADQFLRDLTPYVGVGVAGLFSTVSAAPSRRFFGTNSHDFAIGLRVPAGIEWRPAAPRIGVFFELAPGVGIVPSTFAFLQAGLGIRYYF